MTIEHSWWDQEKWKSHLASRINPYWPYTRNSFTFMPDFTNRVNAAEQYARQVSGISRIEENSERLKTTSVLESFNQALRATADRFEAGLKSYRKAALEAPAAKRPQAFKEVLLVEQMQRMLRSNSAILEFEDLRFKLVRTTGRDGTTASSESYGSRSGRRTGPNEGCSRDFVARLAPGLRNGDGLCVRAARSAGEARGPAAALSRRRCRLIGGRKASDNS